MTRFVSEYMTPDQQVEYCWTNRALFERCRAYSLHRLRLRLAMQPDEIAGPIINGFMVDADEQLKERGF